MSVRAWAYAAALASIFVTFSLQAQELPDPAVEGEPVATPEESSGATAGEGSGSSDSGGAAALTSPLERIEAAVRDLKADVSDEERERQDQREVRDLEAQVNMAHWAMAMFWATAVTVLLTFVALCAILRTLHHTKRAADAAHAMVREAKETTRAAFESVAVTQDSAYRTLRAYVTIDRIRGRIDLGEPSVDVEVIFRNGGQTTAIFLGCRLELRERDKGDIIGFLDMEYGEQIEIGPGGTICRKVGGLISLSSIRPHAVIYVRARYRYVDYTDKESGGDWDFKRDFTLMELRRDGVEIDFSSGFPIKPEESWRQ